MRSRPSALNNQQGFTLIEIIAVLVLLGILAAVAVPKYMDLTANAKNKAIDGAISELSSRESLNWGNLKLAATPPTSDALMDAACLTAVGAQPDLGTDYTWNADITSAGGALRFQSTAAADNVALTRLPATLTAPARWKR